MNVNNSSIEGLKKSFLVLGIEKCNLVQYYRKSIPEWDFITNIRGGGVINMFV